MKEKMKCELVKVKPQFLVLGKVWSLNVVQLTDVVLGPSKGSLI